MKSSFSLDNDGLTKHKAHDMLELVRARTSMLGMIFDKNSMKHRETYMKVEEEETARRRSKRLWQDKVLKRKSELEPCRQIITFPFGNRSLS
jgi:hypothetical protein